MANTETLEKWAVEEKSSTEWLWLSSVRILEGDLESAKTALDKAQDLHAEGVMYHLVHGQLLLASNDLDAAKTQYESAVAMDPNCIGAHKKIFEIALLEQDIDESKIIFSQISKLDPWYTPSALPSEPIIEIEDDEELVVTPDLESLAIDTDDPDVVEVDLSKGGFDLPDLSDEEDDIDFDSLAADAGIEADEEVMVDEEDVSGALEDMFGDTPAEAVAEATPEIEEEAPVENEAVIPMTGDDVSATIDALFEDDLFGVDEETVEAPVAEEAPVLEEVVEAAPEPEAELESEAELENEIGSEPEEVLENEIGSEPEAELEEITTSIGEEPDEDIFGAEPEEALAENESLTSEDPLAADILDTMDDLFAEDETTEEEPVASAESETMTSEDPLAADILDTMDGLFGEETTDETPADESAEEFFGMEETTGESAEQVSTDIDDLDLDSFLEEETEEDVGAATPTIAEIYVQQGLYGKAISTYEELLSQNPEDSDLSTRLDELRKIQEESGEE